MTLHNAQTPCNEMNVVSSTVIGQSLDKYIFELEINYLSEIFQEIQNKKDFGFEAFWSSIGGFVGIFLGYSMLQIPEMVPLIIDFFKQIIQ